MLYGKFFYTISNINIQLGRKVIMTEETMIAEIARTLGIQPSQVQSALSPLCTGQYTSLYRLIPERSDGEPR